MEMGGLGMDRMCDEEESMSGACGGGEDVLYPHLESRAAVRLAAARGLLVECEVRFVRRVRRQLELGCVSAGRWGTRCNCDTS
ncbi:hypothetical protein NDU88_007105 [Pleurodeles waltl]|uniref:Uncharacterized protein n=1 Tax=Pleurodeles waltl TaxID=8319 RepID=A0AAV7QMR5_PLEWA|nr:hypothetical protein NDU88_007105 [Pleurodeles waltl]